MSFLRIRRRARRQRPHRAQTPGAVRPDPGIDRGPARDVSPAPARGATEPAACPPARCARCGFVFPVATVVATCPRCLEPFARTACHGGCWNCPLLRSKA